MRKKIIETGDVDVMISIRSNFFYTRSVPCELWFFDRAKPAARSDKALMLDARHVYRMLHHANRRMARSFSASRTSPTRADLICRRSGMCRSKSFHDEHAVKPPNPAMLSSLTRRRFIGTRSSLTDSADV